MSLFRALFAPLAAGLSLIFAWTVAAQDLSAAQHRQPAKQAVSLRPPALTPRMQPPGKAGNHRGPHRSLSGHRRHRATGHHPASPSPANSSIVQANAEARVEPDTGLWRNAIQQYAYADGSLYQVYAAPGRVTDIALQEGEELTGSGPVAAGDTVRWIIGDTVSGTGAAKRIHLLVKPTRADLATNLVINTDRRTYHLELRAQPVAYMAALSWTYPQDQLIAIKAATAAAEKIAPVASGLDVTNLNFRYRIDGDKPVWRPLRAFDDGHQTFIEFPESIATGDMPPLFVTGADGLAELVNYRVKGRYMVVDLIFTVAELRLGTKRTKQSVRITRDAQAKGKRA
jgi:type IV secretion system protein VirB9